MVASKRFKIALAEVFLLIAIPSGMTALLLPAVITAKIGRGGTQSLAWFTPFAADNGWSTYAQFAFVPVFAMVVGAIPVLLLFALKRLFPNVLDDRIVWIHPPKPHAPDIVEAISEKQRIGQAIALVATSAFATSVLLFVASCIRVDKMHRRPVVTWVMITEDWATVFATAAWILTFGVMLLASVDIDRCKNQRNRTRKALSILAVCVCAFNLLGSCFIYSAAYED